MPDFQYENVIFPDNEPMVLVNRDWQIPGRRQKASKSILKTKDRGAGGKVHTFRVKNKEEANVTMSTQPCSSRTKKPAGRNEISDRQSVDSGVNVFRVNAPSAKRLSKSREREGRRSTSTSLSISDRSTPSEDDAMLEALLLNNDNLSLMPNSYPDYYAMHQASMGIDPCILQLASYKVPDFIPKDLFLNYYVIHIADYLYPLKGRYKLNPLLTVWLPIIMVDELWFYCIMYTVARHLHADPTNNRSYDRACVYLVDIIYRKLQRRLETSTDGEGLTDVDCAAVACLLGVEHAFGTKEGAAQHAKGLASFVSKRGGVDSLSGVLRTKICRADIEAAIDHSTTPAITYPTDGEPLAASLPFPGPLQHFETCPAADLLLDCISLQIAIIARDFLYLTTYLNENLRNHQLIDAFLLDDAALSLQHRLARCEGDWLSPLDRAFRVACLIYTKCLIKDLALVAQTSRRLVTQLWSNLELSETVPKPLLIWLLFIGLIGGQPLDEERIHMSALLVDELRTVGEQVFPSWLEVRAQLQQIAWVDAVLDGVGEQIWYELDAVALISSPSSTNSFELLP